jgi:drug/metabolite transporter (DMT)-like permease
MITLIEPPTAALVAWLVFGETFTELQWLGFAIVLGSLLMFEILARAD